MRGPSIQQRLKTILTITLFFIAVTIFGTLQIAKGAKFHELNILHLKYLIELSDLSTLFSAKVDDGANQVDIKPIITAVKNIRAQPMECLELVTPLDAFFMRLIKADHAIALCEDDIKLAEKVLVTLEKYQQGRLSVSDLTQGLRSAMDRFSTNSVQFQTPIQKMIDFTTISVTLIVIVGSIFVIIFIFIISRSISRTVVLAEQTSEKLIESEAKNRQLAHYDVVSGLPNRNLFMEQLNHTITRSKRDNTKFALLFLDLDQFKVVNDTYGHVVGDKLLAMVAERLTKTVREADTVARLGGDEFTIILPNQTRLEHVANIAQSIIGSLAAPFLIGHKEVIVKGSIGITTYPEDAKTSIELIKHADAAMYQAKETGKNKFEFYSLELNEQAHLRLQTEEDLHKALAQKELCLYYQPIVRLSNMQTIGAEALLRWNHPSRGMIPPDKFIPIAEDTGAIINIGEWVLHKACQQLSIWKQSGHNEFTITVNVSVKQLNVDTFSETVRKTIEQSGIDPSDLGLEITESLFLDINEVCMNNLNTLNGMGVRLMLDDFGTGYSSFSYLHSLPFHLLKIDRSFIQEIKKASHTKEISASIIHMAHNLKMEVTAEGVETIEDLRYLNERNCDFAQGFLFDKPMPAERFYNNKIYQGFIKEPV